MIILWSILILLAILLILFLASNSRVHVYYRNHLKVTLFLMNGWIKIPLIPETKQNKQKKKNSKEKEEQTKEKKTIAEQIEAITDLLSIYSDCAVDIRNHFRFETFDFILSFGTGDAASTALLSGMSWSLIYQILGFVDTAFMLEEPRVCVKPDFENTSFDIYFETTFKTNHFHAIRIGMIVIIKYLKRSKEK